MDGCCTLGTLDASEVILSSYLSNFGQALAEYEARKSPLGAAMYQTATGKSPYEQPVPRGGQQPGQATGPQAPGRYRRPGSGVDPAMLGHVPLDMNPAKQPIPLDPDAGTVDTAVVSGGAPSINVSSTKTNSGASGGGYQPGGGAGGGNSGGYDSSMGGGGYPIGGFPGVFSTIGSTPPPSGDGPPTFSGVNDNPGPISGDNPVVTDGSGGYEPGGGGDAPYDPYGGGDYGDNMALGGVAGSPMTARVGESGPEMAGGKLVTNPSIVRLAKGDTVVPLTPRPNNKLQPDLLEGHLAAPKPQGLQYSRYKSYGQGRGLMR